VMWQEHAFASLRPGMMLTSMGGHRWKLLAIDGTEMQLRDMETGGETRYVVEAHRMGWTYVVASASSRGSASVPPPAATQGPPCES
jgi:hypothetical protein